jgi:hypothetical protein
LQHFKKLVAPQISSAISNLFFSPHGFTPTTLVKIPDGYKPINELKPDDAVICVDQFGRRAQSKVLLATRFTTNDGVVVACGQARLVTTKTQLFSCAGDPAWQNATNFSLEPQLKTLGLETLPVKQTIALAEPTALVSLSLENCHNFCITRQDILVHNFAIAAPALVVGEKALEVVAACLAAASACLLQRYFYRARPEANDSAQSKALAQTTAKLDSSAALNPPHLKPNFLTLNKTYDQKHSIAASFVAQWVSIKFLEWFDRKSRETNHEHDLFCRIIASVEWFLKPLFDFSEGIAKFFFPDSAPAVLQGNLEPLPGLVLSQNAVNAALDRHLQRLPTQSPQHSLTNQTADVAQPAALPSIILEQPETTKPKDCGSDNQENWPIVTDCGHIKNPTKEEQLGCIFKPEPIPGIDDKVIGCGPTESITKADLVFIQSKPGNGPRNTRPPKDAAKPKGDKAPKVGNVEDFINNTPPGRLLKGKIRKIPRVYSGHGNAPVYEVLEDVPELALKKGYIFYQDRFHRNEIEVFPKLKEGILQKLVINTNGKVTELNEKESTNRDFKRA